MVPLDVVHPPAVATAMSCALRAGEASNLVPFALALAITVMLIGLQRAVASTCDAPASGSASRATSMLRSARPVASHAHGMRLARSRGAGGRSGREPATRRPALRARAPERRLDLLTQSTS